MKLKAFTLMEILITVGIVGIIATVMLRVLPNVMPDVNKAKFLRAYTATKIVIQDMINAVSLYPDEDPASSTYGFKNTMQPLVGMYADPTYSGPAKFPRIFADRFGEDATESGGEYSFYSMRDNLKYVITEGASSSYTIKFINADNSSIGGVKVTYDGGTTCIAGDNQKNYCGDVDSMTNLRKQ